MTAPNGFATKPGPYDRQSGFTLLEILLSFSLLAVILTMAYSGLQTIHRQSTQITEREKLTSQVRVVDSLIRKQLKAALPIPIPRDRFDQRELFFKGEPASVQFVGPLPPYAPSGGVYYQRFAIEQQGNRQALVFRFKPLNLLKRATDMEEQVLLIESESIGLSFEYRRQSSEPDDQWRTTWDEPKSLPGLVRLRIESSEIKERLNWSDLIIAPYHGQQ